MSRSSGMIHQGSLISQSTTQISSDLAGEAAILSLADGVYYGLDQVGAVIWNMLAQPRTVAQLCAAVLDNFDVEAEQCERDVVALLEDLAARGLVKVVNGNGT